jgi:putative inorganic carbon (HCO3(-)) transporter
MYTPEIFAQFAPNPEDVHVAHSIYFSILGEHGVIGLTLFIAFWIVTWKAASATERDLHVSHGRDLEWARMLCAMAKVSMLGYLVGGAFLSLAYFDFPYYLMALVALTRRVATMAPPAPELTQFGRPPRLLATQSKANPRMASD